MNKLVAHIPEHIEIPEPIKGAMDQISIIQKPSSQKEGGFFVFYDL